MAALLLSAGVAQAPASVPAPPPNDNYINSLELNRRGTPLNSVDTLKATANTTGATVQPNLFNPCGKASCPSGPAEMTTCKGASYGNTVWYDFYPQADGSVRIRTSGFDNVIGLYTFNTNTLIPTPSACRHQGHFPSEELDAKVQKGHAYTIQVGGVNNSGGHLEFLFDYFMPPPRRLSAQATVAASATATSVSLISVTVQTAHGTRVNVTCGNFCRPQTKTIGQRGSTTVGFPQLKGVTLPLGAKLQIRVTAPNSIGTLIQYTVVAHNIRKQTFCTEPGSRKPRHKCH
jgi:hypothetical protein